jgi:iron complex outermembrane receptor protein
MKSLIAIVFVFASVCHTLYAQGSLSGIVKDKANGTALSGARLQLKNTGKFTRSSGKGEWKIQNIDAGIYSVIITTIGYKTLVLNDIKVENGKNTELITELDQLSTRFDDITVYGAYKRREKITETPAAITVMQAQDIQRAARGNQLGRALEGLPGVDVVQNGVTDFNVNTRGFNNSTNRRLLVLVDGRDVALQQIGATEWNSFAMPLDEFSRIELVRGPAAALYGANAFNGVLNMTSYAPKDVLGTKVSFLAGDYQTLRADVRHAGISGNLSYKITAGHSQSLNFSRSRTIKDTASLEYPSLYPRNIEQQTLRAEDRNTFSTYGTLRLDYELGNDQKMTGEFGYTQFGDEVMMAGAGRIHVPKTAKPFARLAYNSGPLNIQTTYNARKTIDTMRILAAPPGTIILDDSWDINLDAQYNTQLTQDISFVGGVQVQHQSIGSKGTVFPNDPLTADFQGVYAQAEWKASSQFSLIASARFDNASIHPSQFSPRAALVFTPITDHQFRLSVGRSFQRPNFLELYRKYRFAPALGARGPINFRPVMASINDTLSKITGAQQSLDLGLFSNTAVGQNDPAGIQPIAYGLGNSSLNVESNFGYEFGYKGILSKEIFITVDAYYNRLQNFISGFLPGVNPNFPSWSSAGALPENLRQYSGLIDSIVYAQLGQSDKARLTNLDGKPAFIVSNTNIGLVEQWGVDIGVNYYATPQLLLGANYSYYGFHLIDATTPNPFLAKGEDLLLPNTSPHRFNVSATYTEAGIFDIGVTFRYVEGFKWLAGDFRGSVPAYALVNLNAGVQILDNLRMGINIFNLLDRTHYEILGGSLMPRLSNISATWNL